MVAVLIFRRSAMEAFVPARAGLVEGLLHDVPEYPKEARGSETGDHHHDEFVSERTGHDLR
jgi:hypothetical protein